jgi:DNA invertase Pin-like site-specific DNA recombinase
MTHDSMTHGEHTPSGTCSRWVDFGINDTNDTDMTKRTRPGSPALAVAYLRASKDEQKLSPEAQRASIEAWAAREGVQVAAWFTDQGVCSVTPVEGRPALLAALAALREHGAGVLVVAKRDRVARDVVIGATIGRAVQAAGAALVSAMGEGNGDSPSDAMMRGVVDVFAQYERDMIRARTKAALAAKSAKGERAGSITFGFRLATDGIHVERDEAEQGVLAVVRELRAAGLSQRSIAAELAARGLLSRSGQAFGQTQIARMLARAV